MPATSPHPGVDIPNVDLWGLMFDTQNSVPDTQVIYRSVDSKRHYTKADVKAAATAFGEGLRNLWDWQKGDVFNIYAPNDVDYGPFIFGVLFAGGVVSPANPGYSSDELAFQLTNSDAQAIATTKDFLPAALKAAKQAGIPEDRIILIGPSRDDSHKFKHWTNIRKTSGASRYRRRKLHPDNDLAYLVYSSGTTGLPKGVMLSHRNIVSDLCMVEGAMGSWYKGGQDKFLGVLPFFHIYGLTALVHQPLHRGIELVIMPGFDLKVFLEAVQEHKITFIYVAPPVVVHLARNPLADKYDLSSIRMLTSGAAPLTKELVAAVYKRLNLKITQAYGLSETSPVTHMQPWDEWESSVGSVGKMFPNMEAKYISAEGKELGPGEVGELWLKGPNVFKGYWKNQEATDHAITADGFFKTGDVGYQDDKHNFYITDRVKELIKYKGFQVAPAELEGKLMENEIVNDVAVIGVHDDELQTEVPRAYVVASSNHTSDADAKAIADWLAQKVSHHKKLRGGVRFVDEIPKSASGKILRRVLKERAQAEQSKNGKAKL